MWTAFESTPSPKTLVANTVTLTSEKGGQNDEETVLQIPSLQNEAGIIAEPQTFPEIESE